MPPNPASTPAPDPAQPPRPIKAPRGTRDLYPEDAARIRYIQKAWTDASVRHGFEEIEGPTFESVDLYSVKSGEGILGELFQAFSGKSPEEIEQVQRTGQAPFALRPEFTPTLARMYAARAKQLTKPTKWFTAGPYFRAERPQRGRLREFLQWNVDVIGGASDDLDVSAEGNQEIWTVCSGLVTQLGLSSTVSIHYSDRNLVLEAVRWAHPEYTEDGGKDGPRLTHEQVIQFFELLDRRQKISEEAFLAGCSALRINLDSVDRAFASVKHAFDRHGDQAEIRASRSGWDADEQPITEYVKGPLWRAVQMMHGLPATLQPPMEFDPNIVRGLAYYTGMVFELIADGERAVAGGGRYDNLIELFGGPPTPAVGFAMGDVVLGLLLEDKGLMPEGAELLDAISAPGASRRPEVFVISADDEATDPTTRRLVADLRRGVESHRSNDESLKPWDARRYEASSAGVRPVHARHTYKSTRNLKKLLSDAERQHAKLAAIIHGDDRVQLRNLDRRAELAPKDVPGLPDDVAEFSVNPQSPVYVGRAAAALLGA